MPGENAGMHSPSRFGRARRRRNLSLFGSGFDVEAEDDEVADEVVGFARVFDAEVLTVDGELGFDGSGVILHFNFGWKGYFFGDAMQGEVSFDGGIFTSARDGGRFENGGGIFLHVEEVRALEMAGEAVVVAVDGSGIDGHFGV